MEHALTRTAAENDPDFLARIARRWTDALDQDGAEPSEELLRQLQGAFIRRARHGLHHLEIFATAEQFEHLLTVMNTATNPRTGARGSIRRARRRPGSGGRRRVHRGCPRRPRPDRCRRRRRPGPRRAAGLDLRSRPQKLLDGLVGACKAALAAGGAARRRRTPPPGHGHHRLPRPARPPRDTPGTGAGGQATGPARAAPDSTGSLLFTGPVTAATVRKIACDADIIPVLLGGEGQILDIGRASRIFPPHIRKALTARDRGCAFPGCTIPAPWCEAHHITYWSRGGTTGTDNGTLLCSHHHHLIHKEHWTIQIRTGIPWFIPPPHLDPRQTTPTQPLLPPGVTPARQPPARRTLHPGWEKAPVPEEKMYPLRPSAIATVAATSGCSRAIPS